MRFHEVTHGVYFDDLDAFRIVHNSRYLLFFERTIGAFWARLGYGARPDQNPDAFHLVRANHVEYLRPIEQVGEVRVRVWVEKLGRTSLTFGLRVMPLDEDADYATGTRTLVCIDPDTRRPVPWSDELRSRLEPFRRDGDV